MFSDTKSLAAIPGANQERVAGDQIVAVATELLALAADLSIEAPQLARDLVGFSRRLEAALAALASTGPARGQRGAGHQPCPSAGAAAGAPKASGPGAGAYQSP